METFYSVNGQTIDKIFSTWPTFLISSIPTETKENRFSFVPHISWHECPILSSIFEKIGCLEKKKNQINKFAGHDGDATINKMK